MFTKAYIPYKGYYSSPFCKWQMDLQNEHSVIFGASTAKRWLEQKGIDPKQFDYLYLGFTIHQKQAFYGAPWAAALIGAEHMPGCNVSQACSTSTTCLYYSAVSLETGQMNNVFNLMTDRCSNGPHIVWPNPLGPGGEVIHENWLMDNFNHDPYAKNAMIETAEKVAKEIGATKEDCDEVALIRYNQYVDALKNDREFQKRYFFPLEVRVSKKEVKVIEEDQGIIPSTKEGLAKLKPVLPNGVHSFGAQTHPADGNCAIIVTTKEKASELSEDKNIEIQILSYGFSRVEKGAMAKAPVPAAEMALKNANLSINDIKVIKTHNPFAVNDIYFSKHFNVPVEKMNNYGSSLVFGHPQGPTAGRLIIEMIEELVLLGGGYGLFTGCAAGDTGAALIVKVS